QSKKCKGKQHSIVEARTFTVGINLAVEEVEISYPYHASSGQQARNQYTQSRMGRTFQKTLPPAYLLIFNDVRQGCNRFLSLFRRGTALTKQPGCNRLLSPLPYPGALQNIPQ